LPEVHNVCAAADASLTKRAIEFYPGLWRWRVDADDAKRVLDLQANAEREALLQQAADPAEYFRSLQVSLRYRRDPLEQLGRLADLCNKTNQFNLAIRRTTEAEVADRMQRPDACVVSVQMKDRLADSGVVAVVIAERQGETLFIDELCVSCRAMGRQLEDTMILLAIRGMPQFEGCSEIAFRVQHGPRNEPALAWLAKLLGSKDIPAAGTHKVAAGILREFTPMASITIYEEASAS
jgi:FkbH-like protein